MTMKILVTGGNGFLGSHLVRQLVRRGHSVRVMVQPGTDLDRLDGLDVEVMEGDLLDQENLSRCCQGQETAVHLAAVVLDWGPWELFRSVNIGGTRNLIRAASEQGVRRLVFVSSVAIHRYVGISAGDETWPRDNLHNPYAASKIACEDMLMRAHQEQRLEAVIARPGVFPFGVGDRLALPELLRHHGAYVHVAGGRARLCTAYAPNFAEGLALCAERDCAAGQVYVIADDETPTWREVTDRLFAGVGLAPAKRSVPLAAAMTAAVAAEAWARLSGRPPLLNRYRVSLAGRDCVFLARKARDELGWRPRVGFPEAMEQTVEWLRENPKLWSGKDR